MGRRRRRPLQVKLDVCVCNISPLFSSAHSGLPRTLSYANEDAEAARIEIEAKSGTFLAITSLHPWVIRTYISIVLLARLMSIQ